MEPEPPIIDYAQPHDDPDPPLPWWMKVAASLAFFIAAIVLVQCLRDAKFNGSVVTGTMLGLIFVAVVMEVGVVLYRSTVAAGILSAIWFLVPTCCLSPGILYFAHNMTRAEAVLSAFAIALPLAIAICHLAFAMDRSLHK